MYRDTEQSYGEYTLDVYQSCVDGLWVCEWWKRSYPEECGKIRSRRKQDAICAAKLAIEGLEGLEEGTHSNGL